MPRGRQFLWLLVQLALVLAVIHSFEIEGRRQLPAVMLLAAAGFAVHFWLPARWRPWLFVVLSLGGIGLVLDWRDSLLVLTLGMALIGVCWLPVAFGLRVAALLLAAGNLAYWRSGSEQLFWPVLGTMFMFRLIVYVFQTRHEQRQPLAQTLAYFFMLPNACFTLFPVVDYRTFLRTYYDGEEQAIYQTGIHWIARGLVHLLMYRIIKYHVLPAPHEIDDLPHLALFLAANYALYLRVSGQFHLITGLLHLFGFNLPPTHHWYFLATSFTDIWRRINIYWKDFMQQVFFFPVFFRLRALGVVPAMLLSTAAVFLATWLLHSYQLFWLLGAFPLSANDAWLWLSVGALVGINSLVDYRRARRSSASKPAWSWTRASLTSLQALGMFAAVSLFWGQWTHPMLLNGLRLSLAREVFSVDAVGWIAGMVAVAILLGALAQRLWREVGQRAWRERWISPAVMATANLVLMLAIGLAGQTQLYRAQSPQLAELMNTMKQDAYTPLEEGQLVQGYYEEITEASLQSGVFLGTRRGAADKYLIFADMTRGRDDLLQFELIPGFRGVLGGSRLSVNRWGMRDRQLEQKKPPGTYRVAMVGSSIVMGYGVRDDEVFDSVLEELLNKEQSPGGLRLELLNFGVGGYGALHRRLLIEQRVKDFDLDAIFYFAHQDEYLMPPQHVAHAVTANRTLPDACLVKIVERARIPPGSNPTTAQALLTPHAVPLVACAYENIVKVCRALGVLPVWVYLPMPGVTNAPPMSRGLMDLAEDAGFLVVDLSDWAEGHSPDEVKREAVEHHTNALGNRLIAEQLFEVLCQRPELIPAFVPARAAP